MFIIQLYNLNLFVILEQKTFKNKYSVAAGMQSIIMPYNLNMN